LKDLNESVIYCRTVIGMINHGSLGFGVNYSYYAKGQCCLLFTVMERQ